MTQTRRNPYIFIAISIVNLSFAAIFVRLSNAPFLILGFYRLFFTVLILSPLFIYTKSWRKYYAIPRKTILAIIGAGILLAIHFSLWFLSLDFTSIASSMILVDTNAIFVAIFAYLLLKERLDRGRILGILIAFIGVSIIAVIDWSNSASIYGDILALISAIAFSFYLLLGRKLRQKLDLLPYVFLLYLSCAITFLFSALIWGYPFFSYGTTDYLIILGLAVIPTIFGHTLYNWALKYVEAAIIGVSLLAEPICSILLAIWIFGEIASYLVIGGGALVLSGIYITVRIKSKHEKVEKIE
jgi:drug/metabolite transporter (DMT)-like permease